MYWKAQPSGQQNFTGNWLHCYAIKNMLRLLHHGAWCKRLNRSIRSGKLPHKHQTPSFNRYSHLQITNVHRRLNLKCAGNNILHFSKHLYIYIYIYIYNYCKIACRMTKQNLNSHSKNKQAPSITSTQTYLAQVQRLQSPEILEL